MKKILLVCAFLICAVTQAQAQEKLTNQTVIEMVALGFEKELIIEKINSSTCEFQTDIETLKLLKEKGVSATILTVMVKASKPVAVKAKTGIYVLTDSTEVQLLPSVFSGNNTNTLAAFFTYGIVSSKITSTIHGMQARHSLSDGNCSFLFYFDPAEQSDLKTTNWWFQTATSPNEFALIALDVDTKNGCRKIKTGSVNRYAGTSRGVENTIVQEFNVSQEAPGVFRVTPSEPLPAGEYCFYYQGTIPVGGVNNQSVFDFSIAASPDSLAQTTKELFAPVVGYVTQGQAVDGLALPEGLLYVGTLGGWNGSKYTKGLYLEPSSSPAVMGTLDNGSERCTDKGMVMPSRDQLRKIVAHKVIADNAKYSFETSYYWSSTPHDDKNGWCVQAPSGEYQSIPKNVEANVRCVKEY